MGVGDPVQGQWLADRNGEVAPGGCLRELSSGVALCLDGEIVAAEKADHDVVKQQGPEVQGGWASWVPYAANGPAEGDDLLVEGGIACEVDLDDAIDFVGCAGSDAFDRIGCVEGDGRLQPQAGDLGELVGASH